MILAMVGITQRVFTAETLSRAVSLAVFVLFTCCTQSQGHLVDSAASGSGDAAQPFSGVGDHLAGVPSNRNESLGGAAVSEGLSLNDDHRDSRSNFGPGRFNSRFKKSTGFVQVSKVVDSRSSRLTNVWISANLVRAMHSPHPEIPDGTVAIKEFDTVEGKRLGVMVKMGRGYDPLGHDWYYEVRDQTGELLQDPPSGKIAACKSCHERQQGNGGLKSMSLSH